MGRTNKDIYGFEIIDSVDRSKLSALRESVFTIINKHIPLASDNIESALNGLHARSASLSDGEFNDLRTKIIYEINDTIDCGRVIYDVFKNYIEQELGPDLLVQKNSNLVIQRPFDNNPSEIHRDAPLNSCYELVIWVPLVDCFDTKSMYMVKYDKTKSLYETLNNDQDWEKFERDAIDSAERPTVKFGQALAFSTTVLHGSTINKENETRVSLNIRYKNIFSPSGLKNQLQFFEILKTSNITKLGSDLEFDVELFNNSGRTQES